MNTAMINKLSTLADISYGETILNGLSVVVVGLLGVFGVLALIWGVLTLFKIFFYDMPEKERAAKMKAQASVVVAPPAEEPEEEEEEEADDTQLIAVITAAIAAYTAESGKSSLPFRVVSYKRVRGANGWNGADENETV